MIHLAANEKFPKASDIKAAKDLIEKYAHKTPILTSTFFNNLFGGSFFFKCDNFQKSGSFKFRGATNAVLAISKEQKDFGVATHSSGNFGQALAMVAKMNGIKAFIVMPKNAPSVKYNATKSYGAEIIQCEPTLEARESTLLDVINKTGASFIHPYDDYKIIEGQSSAMMEILDEISDFDNVIAPVGGGGLISGTILARNYFAPHINVIGAEPKDADDAYRSWKSNSFVPSVNPQTVCDGLKTSLGKRTLPIILDGIDQIFTASEENVLSMMKLVWERMKIIVEPSSASTLAAIYENRDYFINKKTVIIISGGNVDLDNVPWKK
ncbi:MAG: threonine/serine dehydratase [Bacteroidetes bacterium]|nr:threonine/serine dehydratase [Bacteroidota bacterium]